MPMINSNDSAEGFAAVIQSQLYNMRSNIRADVIRARNSAKIVKGPRLDRDRHIPHKDLPR
jgi:hypothetical protein